MSQEMIECRGCRRQHLRSWNPVHSSVAVATAYLIRRKKICSTCWRSLDPKRPLLWPLEFSNDMIDYIEKQANKTLTRRIERAE